MPSQVWGGEVCPQRVTGASDGTTVEKKKKPKKGQTSYLSFGATDPTRVAAKTIIHLQIAAIKQLRPLDPPTTATTLPPPLAFGDLPAVSQVYGGFK